MPLRINDADAKIYRQKLVSACFCNKIVEVNVIIRSLENMKTQGEINRIKCVTLRAEDLSPRKKLIKQFFLSLVCLETPD